MIPTIQQLAPVVTAPGTNYVGIGLLIAVIAGVVVLVLQNRKKKDSPPAIVVHGVVPTVTAQPVSQVPEVTAQPATPVALIQPAPAAVLELPPQPAAPAAPAPLIDPSTNKPYTADQLARLAERAKNLAQWQTDLDSRMYTGPVPAVDVTLDEALYLYAVSRDNPSLHVHFAVLSGTHAQIASVINVAGSTHAAEANEYNASLYHGRLLPYVQAVMAGTLKPAY